MRPDGSLVPWRSPAGRRLRIAAAAPVIPWTDLLYAIAPNGRTFTHTVAPRGVTTDPVGVFKVSLASGIFVAAQFALGPGQPVGEPFVPGRPMGYLSPPGVDPQADVTTWVTRAAAAEPYTDPASQAIVRLLQRYHSAYHIDAGSPPPPLLVASGFTDDLFPVDEALRFVNRMRRDHPRVPVSVLLGDFGHQRASNKPVDRRRLLSAIRSWFDHHLRGRGAAPRTGATALTQTCPATRSSGGPFRATSFDALARGEVRFTATVRRRVLSSGGDPAVGQAVDPVAGGGNACAQTGTSTAPGTAAYRLPPARGAGFTLLGAPTIKARLRVTGAARFAQVAARLWDVAPGGRTQTLVARGVYRPSGGANEAWQLHANGWHFARGHVARLELLGHDAPYGRPSNLPFAVDVRRLELRLPVRERPDCRVVLPRAAPVHPRGQSLAPGVSPRAAPGCRAGGGGDRSPATRPGTPRPPFTG